MAAPEYFSKAAAEAFAKLLPPGSDFALFLISDTGEAYFVGLAASLGPDVLAPIIRNWLERYDRGETWPETLMKSALDS